MRIAKFITAAALGLFALGAAAQADVLDDIKKRGTLIVGVKADYKPFGFRDTSGGIIGLGPTSPPTSPRSWASSWSWCRSFPPTAWNS